MVGDTNLFYLWRKIRTRASQSTEPDENDDFHGFEESEMDRKYQYPRQIEIHSIVIIIIIHLCFR